MPEIFEPRLLKHLEHCRKKQRAKLESFEVKRKNITTDTKNWMITLNRHCT